MLFDKNIESYLFYSLTRNDIKDLYSIHLWYIFALKYKQKPFFGGDSFINSNTMLYLRKKLMSKIQAKKLSLKFVPYLFVAVTILTAFSSNGGTWV